MEWSKRVVTSMPLAEIWTLDGPLDAKRMRPLSGADIAALLRKEAIEFVIADPGLALTWVQRDEALVEWKNSIKSHVAEPDVAIYPERFAGAYCFLASEWRDVAGKVFVLLEKHH